MPGFLRKLLTPSLRDQLEGGVREALKRYADRHVAPVLRVYVTTDLIPQEADPELWVRDEEEHLNAFARQWAQDNGIPEGAIEIAVILLDTKREFAFVKPVGLGEAQGEGERMTPPSRAASTRGVELEVVRSETISDPVVVRDETVLGRKAGPGVTPLGDRYMSARHAKVSLGGGKVTITDLDSKNRTFVNGEPVPPHEPRALSVGDSIRMGETELRVADISL